MNKKMLRTLFAATILAGALAGSAMAQAPDAGCAFPSEPEGIPAALDAAISGPADKDRACMKALFIPEARLMFVSLGADGAPNRRLETLDRSEEHTSELQSQSNLVCRLLLEKKKKTNMLYHIRYEKN